jgi:transposase InsO family protein
MPLKVMDVVELRLKVLLEVDGGLSPREAAARHQVSKTQVYEWLARRRAEGLGGLAPRSRRPVTSPTRVPAPVEDEIVRLRRDRPRWGAKKIRARLVSTGWPEPSVSTVHRVLVRRGLVTPGPRRCPPPGGWTRFTRPCCNDLWQIDATRHPLADGGGYWVVDLVDDHSRYLLAAQAAPAATGDAAWAAFRLAAGRAGLPRQLLSDNGLCFTGRLHHGVTVPFERLVGGTGVQLIHARPYHPETLGKLERQHRTQNDWLADRPAPADLPAAQHLLDTYRQDYNHHRPHEALDQHTPADHWTPDPGVDLPATDLPPADPYPPGCLRRHVDHTGRFVWSRRAFHLDPRWAGVEIGLVRDHGRLHVFYGTARITTLIIGEHPDPQPRGRKPRPQ